MCQAQLLMFALAQVEREGDLKLPRAAAEPELGVFLVWQGDSQNKGVCPQNPAHPARPASCSPWTLLWAGSEQVRQVVSPVKPQFLHLSKKKKKLQKVMKFRSNLISCVFSGSHHALGSWEAMERTVRWTDVSSHGSCHLGCFYTPTPSPCW